MRLPIISDKTHNESRNKPKLYYNANLGEKLIKKVSISIGDTVVFERKDCKKCGKKCDFDQVNVWEKNETCFSCRTRDLLEKK